MGSDIWSQSNGYPRTSLLVRHGPKIYGTNWLRDQANIWRQNWSHLLSGSRVSSTITGAWVMKKLKQNIRNYMAHQRLKVRGVSCVAEWERDLAYKVRKRSHMMVNGSIFGVLKGKIATKHILQQFKMWPWSPNRCLLTTPINVLYYPQVKFWTQKT